jgi:hypothetical protein
VALAEKLRKAATERHALPGSLVAQALEQFLSGASGSAPALSGDSSKWEQRLAAVEQQLAYLEGRLKTPLSRPASPPPAAVPSPPPAKPLPIPQSGDALTTAQVADKLGMKRGSFNERIRRAGGAVVGLEMEGWRIVGQSKPPQGGPPQWLWEPASKS